MTHPQQTPRAGEDQELHYFFIKRPVLAIVISLIITLLGVFAIRLLPISRYPQITPPAVQVQAGFPWAPAGKGRGGGGPPVQGPPSRPPGPVFLSAGQCPGG